MRDLPVQEVFILDCVVQDRQCESAAVKQAHYVEPSCWSSQPDAFNRAGDRGICMYSLRGSFDA